ncbi:oligopeptide:H+ symporter [Paractinoplanes ferrugineus]|uniref:Peptide transporter n=1 Tax=Paractinoplanes ferrugineus TaxID=113564 RepID=A0A919J4E5_9ACTN|nr:peptide MFS transporter [Actinoplanes ferrugineus]GIE13715.1 peptide transporter [Actinoplanes ferrugineus]
MTTQSPPAPPAPQARPRGFGALFLTDLWERFGFYGMQAILVLYAADPRAEGGLGLPPTSAAALFGAYLGLTFMLSLPGGWIGDRILGTRRAVLWGTLAVATGYFVLALPTIGTAPLGLLLVSLGTALLKPNLTTMLSLIYGRDSHGREAGISLFYVGIQLSAMLGPLVTGFLGETIDWNLGFAAAGVAMLLGTAHYLAGYRRFGDTGAAPARPIGAAALAVVVRRTSAIVGAVLVAVVVLVLSGAASAELAIIVVGLSALILPTLCFFLLVRRPELTERDRSRMRSFLWLLFGAALFWMIVGQDGALLNLFAQRSTDRTWFGFAIPASWLQSATPVFILILAPLLARWWTTRGSRSSAPVKFSVGLSFAGVSFLIMAVAADRAAVAAVSPGWLVSVYLLHACGELVVASVGISAAIDAAPRTHAGQMIGVWWLFSAMGAGLGSQVVRLADVLPDSVYYGALGALGCGYAGLLFVRRRRIAGALAVDPANDRAGDPTRTEPQDVAAPRPV